MDDFLLQEYYFKLKLIGIYQIIGGVIGLGINIWTLTMVWPFPLIIASIFVVSISSFLFSVGCGLGLAYKKSWAVDSSFLLQLMQIIHFTLFGFSFQFLAGLGIIVNIDFTNSLQVALKASEPSFLFTYMADPNQTMIGINLAAILIAILIIDFKRKITRLSAHSDLTNIETSPNQRENN